jgi:hypothetical protein
VLRYLARTTPRARFCPNVFRLSASIHHEIHSNHYAMNHERSLPFIFSDAATGWSEFWSLPSVAESLSLAIKTPLPASYSMSFLAPHLSHLGLSHTPLRVVVSDGVKKRVSTPFAVRFVIWGLRFWKNCFRVLFSCLSVAISDYLMFSSRIVATHSRSQQRRRRR